MMPAHIFHDDGSRYIRCADIHSHNSMEAFFSAFQIVIHLALPFIAAEFVVEISMGILMKLIPQIHVFVINIQTKVLLGLFMLLVFTKPITDLLNKYMDAMMRTIQQALTVLSA